MTLFMTNNTGMLSRRGAQDIYSQFTYAAPVRTACCVVKLADLAKKTSVRTDQSGSRGSAEEDTVSAMILFPPSVRIRKDDQFEIAGMKLRVIGVQPRFDVFGGYDHDETTLGALVT